VTSNFAASLPIVNPDNCDRAQPTRLQFGNFVADLLAGELFCNGTKVPIQDKPFRFLAALLRQPGELITREAISHFIWPDIYVQVNQGLNAAARKVRMALNDDACNPRFVETIGSRGYRFIHRVEVLHWSSAVMESAQSSVRIAMLPFKYSCPEEMELAGGLMQELISLLTRSNGNIRVVGPGALSSLAAANGQLESIRKAFESDYALSVSISVQSRRIKFALTMKSVREDTLVFQKQLEAPFREVGRMLEEVVSTVLENCQSLQPASIVKSIARVNFPEHDDYLRACHYIRRNNPNDLLKAAELLKMVIQSDADFAPAWAGLAKAYNLLGLKGAMPARLAYSGASEKARHALDLDAGNPDAMEELAWSELALDRDWAFATRLLERSLALNPNSASGYCKYAYVLMTRDRFDDALSALEQGYRLTPLSVGINIQLAMMYYYSRRYDDAIRYSRFLTTLAPTCSDAYGLLGLSTLAQRRHLDALAQLRLAAEHSNNNPTALARLAYAEAEAGNFSAAENWLQKVYNDSKPGLEPAYDIAPVLLALGRVNESLQWIERAYQQCSHWVLLMSMDPRLDILHGTKRFEQLRKSLRPSNTKRTTGQLTNIGPSGSRPGRMPSATGSDRSNCSFAS
jgi:DNA-binding winged helix-turn-helix (wHTH) protein/tetratricopeptide (TPR) repeat protein